MSSKYKKNRKKKIEKKVVKAWIYITLIISSIVMMIPFIWLVRSSVMGSIQIFASPVEWIPDPFRWVNYKKVVEIAPFGKYFINTLILVVNGVAGTVLTASITAFAFAKLDFKGKKVLFTVLLGTMMLPYTVTLIPLYVTWSRLGLVGTRVPLMLQAWLGGGAFYIFLLRQFFNTIPEELEEAAYIDGASVFYVYWKIIMPLSKPALIVVGIFTFMGIWNDFLGPLLYLNESQYTLSIGLNAFKSNYTAKWNLLMAASTMVTIPSIIIFFIGQKYFVEGVHLSGLKG